MPHRLLAGSVLLLLASTAHAGEIDIYINFEQILRAANTARHNDSATTILANIKLFFQTTDTDRRVELVDEILADPAYQRENVADWLHAADLFEPMTPGRHTFSVKLPDTNTRQVVLHIPKDYDHTRPYPLIYALHGSTGNGDWAVGYFTRVLGERIDEFIVAAPTDYQERIIHHTHWPPIGEHPAILQAVRQTVHVDADRVVLSGYSMGGHTSWTLAAIMPDQFATAMPLAGSFTLILADKLWPVFTPNMQHLPVTCVWGAGDIYYGGERISPTGGIAGVNRRYREVATEFDVPVTGIELPDAGHKNVIPPDEVLQDIFSRERVNYPDSFELTFRHIYQAQAYWIEGHEWAGGQWINNKRTIQMRPGENQWNDDDFDEAVARAYRGDLGRLEGTVEGQLIDVRRQKVKELTIWIGDGMIDWNAPVTVKISGHEQFSGRLEPSLYVCLSQAARTYDLNRLRWAGLRFRSGSKTRVVGPKTLFPTLHELIRRTPTR